MKADSMQAVSVTSSYQIGIETISFSVTNNSETELSVNDYNTIEKKINEDEWELFSAPAYDAWEKTLAPGEKHDFIIWLYPENYDYSVGFYRVCKTFNQNNTYHEYYFEFYLS